MSLDGSIQNRIAGYSWMAVGGLGVAWLGPRIKSFRQEHGLFGGIRATAGSPEETESLGLLARVFIFLIVWLALFVVLDWIF
jgi:hypothetical protein